MDISGKSLGEETMWLFRKKQPRVILTGTHTKYGIVVVYETGTEVHTTKSAEAGSLAELINGICFLYRNQPKDSLRAALQRQPMLEGWVFEI